MTQRMIEITSPVFIPEERLAADPGLTRLFGAERPLALEIGCGIGDFLIQMASRRPELNFLATDIYNKGCLKTCRKVEAAGLDNVRVVRLEARHLLEHHLSPGSLAAVFINCPDPWPKKRHRRRRLVNADFLALLRQFMAPGGELYFSSDFEDYTADVAAALATLPLWHNCHPLPYLPALESYPISKYMRRFLDQGETIHFLHWRLEPAAAEGELTAEPTVLPAWGRAVHG
ncbi:MAG: tRNA (guanosine(46)-N7)-methyltransferase TrmB [Desulfuromonadales bacterium]|nr:tRNA (guanosine(46)-N7)-methyltransferase TrmB [Desulfuromonadales bacterium]